MSTHPVFTTLSQLLCEAIPNAIATASLPTPLCAVRINYFDTHTDETYFQLRTMSSALRDRLIVRHGWNAPFYLWSSGEEERDGELTIPHDLGTPMQERLAEPLAEIYKL